MYEFPNEAKKLIHKEEWQLLEAKAELGDHPILMREKETVSILTKDGLKHYSGSSQTKGYTEILTPNGPRRTGIPEEDVEALIDIYNQSQNRVDRMNTSNFVLNIGSRIFSEWCMEDCSHRTYRGEGFTNFVEQETHHFLASQYEWSREHNQFLGLNHENYQVARHRVLEGVATRAVELFLEWGNSYPKRANRKTDKRNLRASLESYIPEEAAAS